jgi:hypothetical protein
MKVFVSYAESDEQFDNCIMDIDYMPQSKGDIRDMERTIQDTYYSDCYRIPYIKILNIVPVG